MVPSLAVVNLGSNGSYHPVQADWGPARHPHANFAFFKDASVFSGRLVRSLAPWSPAIATLPRTFLVDSDRNALLESVTGPALRVTCRDTVSRIHFLDEFTAADAGSEFGVLRFNADAMDFQWSRADAETRVRLGDGFLLLGRHDVAAACFEAVDREHPGDPAVVYPLVASLATSGRAPRARQVWAAAMARGATPSPEAFADRLGVPARVSSSERPETLRLAAAVLADPTDASAHSALGHHLLDLGASLQGTLELAIACGLGGSPADLVELGDAYAAMGAAEEARNVYRRGLNGNLDPALREHAAQQLADIETAMAKAAGER